MNIKSKITININQSKSGSQNIKITVDGIR